MEIRALWLVGIEGELLDSVTRSLTPIGVSVETEPHSDAALERLQSGERKPAAIVLGWSGREQDGIEALQSLRAGAGGAPIIMTARGPSAGLIVAVLKAGAADFVAQPATGEEWRKAITGALHPAGAGNGPSRNTTVAGTVLGRAPGMAAIAATLPQVAWSDAPVLIQGETGCGKEVLARAVHDGSQRAKKPFFKLNCAALPSELVESELFGYERGAFTGAFQRKPGIFEAADGGTILLDEIGDMDVRLQAKLLQVLQDHAFQRIGGKELINVDVRVLAATHRNLEKSIEGGSFREDLYYRLNVVTIVVPPLRERREDLFDLTEVLLKKHARDGEALPTLTPGLREAMLEWHWPGNVRELENFARKLLIFRDGEFSERELREHLRKRRAGGGVVRQRVAAHGGSQGETPEAGSEAEGLHVPAMAEVNRLTQRAEADAVLSALNAAHWNRRVAAVLLNVDYKSLLYRMKKLGIEGPKTQSAYAMSRVTAPAEHPPDWRLEHRRVIAAS